MKAEWKTIAIDGWGLYLHEVADGRIEATIYKSEKRDFVVFLSGWSVEVSRYPTLPAAQAAAQEAVLAHLRAEVQAVEAMGKGDKQ